MAESGYLAQGASSVRWDQLAEKDRDAWLAISRAMYGVIAARGGARVDDVREPE